MKELIKILKVFYRFETRNIYAFIGMFILTGAASVLNAIQPYFFKLFVDNLESAQSVLLRILFLFILVRVLALIVHSLAYFVGDIVLHDGVVTARKTIFKQVQDLDFAFHTGKSSGSLISAFKRGDGAYYSLHHVLNHRFTDILVSFLVMAYIFSQLNITITIVALVSFLASIVLTQLVVSMNVQRRNKINEEEDRVSGIIVDNMINYETVKLFAKEKWEQARLDETFKDWLKAAWGYANSFRMIDLTIGGLVNLSIFIILFLTVNFLAKGQISTGNFVLVVAFVNSFFPNFWELVYNYRDVAKNYADIQKYFGILDYSVQIKDPKRPVQLTSLTGEIEFKNVFFSYKEGRKNALNGVNLKIRQGQSVALVGRSGSGKTTFIKLLMRFYDVDKGEITVDGINIKKFTKSQLRGFMGVVPQEPILFNHTIGYNIAYGKDKVSKEEIVAASKLANIHDFIESLSKKYNTKVGERGIKLSGGQKQRLAIARMILSDPDIIIFDEATSQLDSESEKLIREAFWKVARDKTTIIIAHRLSTAMNADKIIVMEKGKVVETGSHNALLARKDSLYKYFWNLQTNID